MGELIVLADDDAELRSIYAEVLRREGHDVHEASDGAEALALMRARRPSLVLLDVWMPVVNGFEVLDRLRGEPTLAATKVVMLSNLSDSDSRLEGFAAGIVDYWIKGLALEELSDRVRKILSGVCSVADPF